MTGEGPPNSEAQSAGERDFRPFREFAASELTFSYPQTPHGPWELRHGGDLVGIVDRTSGLVRGEGGSWRVEVARRVLGWRLVLKAVEQPQPSGSYTPRHVLPGGTIALSEGGSYILRPQRLFGQAWTVSDAHGTELARVWPGREAWVPGSWSVGLGPSVADEPAALLIVLTTCFVILVDQAQRPLSSG